VRILSFKVEDELAELLEIVAKQKGVTKSEIIRRALRNYLMQNKHGKPFVTPRMKIYG